MTKGQSADVKEYYEHLLYSVPQEYNIFTYFWLHRIYTLL
jgi:hypothetical protein